ncbi:hypothetical protein Hdeb2414_s0140g00810741 [Helianthus debilis subsp. tardiflorus]
MSSISGSSSGSDSLRLSSFELLIKPITSSSRASGLVYTPTSAYIQYRPFSSQSDVFSFTVLVLEVIAGQKNATSSSDARNQTLHNFDNICIRTLARERDKTNDRSLFN